MYLSVKAIHIGCAVISIIGFVVRGILVMRGSPLMAQRWIRILPHVNDTVLLVSALTMAGLSAQYPFVTSWLTAKVMGLLAYIVLGVITLRCTTRPVLQRLAFVAALLTFGWIVSVALLRVPTGFLSLLLGAV